MALIGLASIASISASGKVGQALDLASADHVFDLVAAGTFSLIHTETLALVLATLCFLGAALACTLGVLRAQRPIRSALDSALPAGIGLLGSLAVFGIGVLTLGFAGSTLGLTLLTGVGGVLIGLAGGVRSRSAKESARLAEIRASTTVSAVLMVSTWTLVSYQVHTATALQQAEALTAARTLGWLGLFAALTLLASGGLSIAAIWRHLLTPRAVTGFAIAGAGIAAGGLLQLADTIASRSLRYDAFGGAIQSEPLIAVAKLPGNQSLSGAHRGDPISGMCLVTDGAKGWQAQRLFERFDPQVEIDRATADQPDLSELDTLTGCPTSRAPLDGPLSSYDRPLVAIAGDRLAAAVTGQEWFLERGQLQILVAPHRLADTPAQGRARASRSVDFTWERPPEGTQPAPPPDGGEEGDWNYPAARVMLRSVLLLEGPVPMLVANGQRAWLEEGEAGEEQLRTAIEQVQRRDLVLVPRKHWTVDDLTRFCLSVADLEGARCVIRPENTARWSSRTGLALPW